MKIEVKNVCKKFKNEEVLKNVNLNFESGKIYGFRGKNGSGKSVLLKIMCGLYAPTSGEVLYDGVNYNMENKFVPSVRALIEKPNFFPNLTGYENLKLLSEIQNKITDKEINETLESVNLINEKDKKYSNYSLGMKQKLGVAQALMEDPEVIILDEPFNGIEKASVEKIIDILKKKKSEGKIIIVASHYLEELSNLCDKIYSFDMGEVSNYED